MIFVILPIATIGLFIAGIYFIGRALPVGHTATQSLFFATSPEQLWDVITSYGDHPKWRKNLKSVEVLPDREGYRSWREVDSRNGAIVYMEVEKRAPERLDVQIDDTGLPFGGQWTYELNAEDGGTRLTITEDGKVYNPIFRFVEHYLLDETKSMRDYLMALSNRVN